MKNVFKFLGIAFVACSMLVACGDETETFTIKVKANDSSMGTVTGGGKYESGATATLEATANAGYTFVEWNDGVKNNPRTVTVTADAEYVANFAEQTGVKVQFGDATWNAEYINAATDGTQYLVAAAQINQNSYPFVMLYSSSYATGTTTSTCSFDLTQMVADAGDPYLWYYDEDPQFTFDGDGAASWWSSDLTLNVTAIDADAMTIDFVANCTAKHVTELVTGQAASLEACTGKALTMTATKVSLAAKKSLPFGKRSGKIVKK